MNKRDNKIFKVNIFVYLSIYIFLSLTLSIYFYSQGYSDLNDFLGFFNLFSLGIIWELLIGKLNYDNIELLLIILSNLFVIYLFIYYIENKISKKNMYFLIIFLSLISILLGFTLLYLGIYG